VLPDWITDPVLTNNTATDSDTLIGLLSGSGVRGRRRADPGLPWRSSVCRQSASPPDLTA